MMRPIILEPDVNGKSPLDEPSGPGQGAPPPGGYASEFEAVFR